MSASQVARIIGMSHQYLAGRTFFRGQEGEKGRRYVNFDKYNGLLHLGI
jgi:hypothetical protein